MRGQSCDLATERTNHKSLEKVNSKKMQAQGLRKSMRIAN